MAGLGFDNAMPTVISAKTHSVIDYVHVATNFWWRRCRERRTSRRRWRRRGWARGCC